MAMGLWYLTVHSDLVSYGRGDKTVPTNRNEKKFILSYSWYMKENAICGICALSIFSPKSAYFY